MKTNKNKQTIAAKATWGHTIIYIDKNIFDIICVDNDQ